MSYEIDAVKFIGSMKNHPPGLYLDSGEFIPADEVNNRSFKPLPAGLTLDEWLQRRMPSDNMGFALALAIVGGIMIGVLLAHAWARMA